MDGSLLLDTNGFVAEGSGENIFWYRNGAWHTPSCVGALEGIARQTLIDLLRASGEQVIEGQYTLLDVCRADEVVMCGSGAEIVSVGEVDGRRIGTGVPGARGTALAGAYRKHVRSQQRTEIDYGA